MIFTHRLLEKFKKFFMNLSLKFKIIFIFTSFLVAYILVSTIISLYVIDSQKVNQLHQGAQQSIDIMKSNIESNIDSINNISKIIILDPYVRQYLNNPRSNIAYRRILYEKFTQLYVIFPFIESIFIYDFDSVSVNASREVIFSTIETIDQASWFQQVIDLKGKYLINVNAGNTFLSNSGKNNISMIRTVYDVENISPIGTLIINTSQDFFSSSIDEIKSKYGTSFILLDDAGNTILKNNNDDNFSIAEDPSNYNAGKIKKINGSKYFVLSSSIPQYNWTIISYTPITVLSETTQAFNFILLILAISTILLFLVSSFFTAKIVTSPIKRLINSMVGVQDGLFEKVDINTGNDEIGDLKNTYNIMIIEIQKMIEREVETEKQKRKFELDILNEQLNPHFLYNTLDSIGYLALYNNNPKVYKAITSLGQFYKFSLNKGNDTPLFEQEIKMIQEYLSLQKLRYGEIIQDQYEIDPDTLKVPILKNILQPLVENCIYHGIKPSGEMGTITIGSKLISDVLYVTIKDDGLGMTPDEITYIHSDYLDTNTASFGLRGTISRLKLYYGIDDIYEITSTQFEGTSITLKIPTKGVHL